MRILRRNLILGLLAVLLAIAAFVLFFHRKIPCKANNALENSKTFTLFSLQPEPYRGEKPAELFHGYRVLGQMEVSSEDRSLLAKELQTAVSKGQSVVARCFNPRHGIKVQNEAIVFDFVICFECGRMRIIFWGTTNYVSLRGKDVVFNSVLSKEKVPLPPPPKF